MLPFSTDSVGRRVENDDIVGEYQCTVIKRGAGNEHASDAKVPVRVLMMDSFLHGQTQSNNILKS